MPLGYLGFQAIKVYNGIYIYIPGVSTTIRFWCCLQKTYSYWVPLDIFFGRFMKNTNSLSSKHVRAIYTKRRFVNY